MKTKALGRVCAVCGTNDERMLVEVKLLGGANVTLCGSHALVHRRAREQARSIAELRAIVGERRTSRDRRGDDDRSLGEIDALGRALTEAFAGERRAASDRRRIA